jgi:hypothetical protein
LKGPDRRLWLKGNGLQRKKTQKAGKTGKKVQNSFRGTPVFLQNSPNFPPKTGLLKKHSLQAADGQRLPISDSGKAGENGGMMGKGIKTGRRFSSWLPPEAQASELTAD